MRAGPTRDHGERAAALHAVHLEGRARPEALERREPGLAVQRGDADLDAVGLLVEGHPRERIPVGDRERADVVVEAGDGHRAVGLVQAGEELRQRVQRILDRAAVPARVEIAPRAGDDDLEREEPLGRDRDRGLRGPPHRAVRRDDEVRFELAAVVSQDAGEARASDLLLALEEEAHVQRQRPERVQERLRNLQRDEHRALVVGRAARVDAPVADGRRERRRHPLGLVPRRLHVVVAVDEYRRRARRLEPFAEHDRMSVRLDDAAARERELRRNPLRRLPELRLSRRVGADARDAQELRQLAHVARAVVKRWSGRHRSRSPAP